MPRLQPTRSPGLRAAIAAAGGITKLAQLLQVHPSSISSWWHVPPKRVEKVARLTGLDPETVEK